MFRMVIPLFRYFVPGFTASLVRVQANVMLRLGGTVWSRLLLRFHSGQLDNTVLIITTIIIYPESVLCLTHFQPW